MQYFTYFLVGFGLPLGYFIFRFVYLWLPPLLEPTRIKVISSWFTNYRPREADLQTAVFRGLDFEAEPMSCSDISRDVKAKTCAVRIATSGGLPAKATFR